MDVAKSLFGSRDHEGYAGKDEHMVCRFFYVSGGAISLTRFFFASRKRSNLPTRKMTGNLSN